MERPIAGNTSQATTARPLSRWLSLLEQNDRRTYWITYTVLFLALFVLMGLVLFVQGKGFIWLDDGLTQQYTSFVQLGDFYHQLGAALGGTADIPMFSPTVGYGNDVLLALVSYIANPLYLVAAVATPETADIWLNATVPVTLFLAGIFFTLFARNHSSNGFAILIGCMVFVFSGFTLTTLYQIHMMFPLMLCPLVFLGAELVFQHRSPVLFPVAMALLMANALDAAYDCCILLFVYCLVRFFTLEERRTLRGFVVWFGKFFGLLALAACISAILFLPTAYSILTQDRLDLERNADLIYSFRYYYRLITGFIAFSRIGSESFYGVFPVAVLALAALAFMPKSRQRTALLVLFAGACIILLFPFFGRVMNGFAYPNNRWSWAFSLLMGYITVAALPSVMQASSKSRKKIFIVLALGVVVGLGIFVVTRSLKPNPAYLCALIVLGLLAVCMLVLQNKGNVLRIVVMASLLVSCGSTYWLWGTALDPVAIKNHELSANAYNDMVTSSANGVAGAIDAADALEQGYRYDTVAGAGIWRNASIPVGTNGVSFYNSIYNDAIDKLHTELGLVTSPFNISFSSLDSRLVLEQLAGVKYLIVPGNVADALQGSEGEYVRGFGNVPAGYTEERARYTVGGTAFALLEAEQTLPLAFTYDQACSQESLEGFSPVQKQDALILEMALNESVSEPDTDRSSLGPFSDTAELDRLCHDVAYTAELVYADGTSAVYADGENFDVPPGGADLHITSNVAADMRAYLQLEDVQFTESRSALSTENATDGFVLGITCGGFSSGITQTTPESSLYGGKDIWAANLGVAQAARNQIAVHFSEPGTYSIGKLAVTLEDEAAVLAKLKELGEHAASDIAFKGNTLTCTIDTPERADGASEYLFVRLPYSEGWSAMVDGEKAEIMQADYGFMAIELPAGEHAVEFTYETPFLKIGALLSVLGIVALIALAVAYRRISKRL